MIGDSVHVPTTVPFRAEGETLHAKYAQDAEQEGDNEPADLLPWHSTRTTGTQQANFLLDNR